MQIWGHLAKTPVFQLFWGCGLLRICQDWSLNLFYLKKGQDKTTPAAEQKSVTTPTFKINGVGLVTRSNCPKDCVSGHCLRTLTICTHRLDQIYEGVSNQNVERTCEFMKLSGVRKSVEKFQTGDFESCWSDTILFAGGGRFVLSFFKVKNIKWSILANPP